MATAGTTPTSSHVVDLRPGLWENAFASPSLLLVNVCRPTCGFCQALAPKWELLAAKLRSEAVVSYWNGEAHGAPPSLIGEANATPTIRAFVPSAGPGLPRRVLEYHGRREVPELLRFAAELMPSYVAVVGDEAAWRRAEEAAAAARLPRLLCFVDRRADSPTPPLLKALSAAFRTRVAVTEVRAHPSVAGTAAIAERFGVRDLPAVLALGPGASVDAALRHDGPPTFRRLRDFVHSNLVDEGGERVGEG